MIETPGGIQMIERTDNAAEDAWLDRVKSAAAEYRKAQNVAQDASEGLTEAIGAARAAGVSEARILSVATV